jgi:hypothetical protein
MVEIYISFATDDLMQDQPFPHESVAELVISLVAVRSMRPKPKMSEGAVEMYPEE